MNAHWVFPLIISISTLFITLPSAGAAGPFLDPGIPDGETAAYTATVADRSMTVIERVTIKRDGPAELYEISSFSDTLDRKLVLDKQTMAILSVHTIRKYPEVTLDSKLRVRDEKPQEGKDVVKLADFAVMIYLLRGFPFTRSKELKIGFYGEEQGRKFSFKAQYRKREEVTVNQGSIECYKIEFGLDGFWGTFFPKMNVWYSVAPPHYLVRYRGLVGPPGSPRRDVILDSYSISKQPLHPSFDELYLTENPTALGPAR